MKPALTFSTSFSVSIQHQINEYVRHNCSQAAFKHQHEPEIPKCTRKEHVFEKRVLSLCLAWVSGRSACSTAHWRPCMVSDSDRARILHMLSILLRNRSSWKQLQSRIQTEITGCNNIHWLPFGTCRIITCCNISWEGTVFYPRAQQVQKNSMVPKGSSGQRCCLFGSEGSCCRNIFFWVRWGGGHYGSEGLSCTSRKSTSRVCVLVLD